MLGLFKAKYMNSAAKSVRGEVEKILRWCIEVGGVEEELLGWNDLNNAIRLSTMHKLSGMTKVKFSSSLIAAVCQCVVQEDGDNPGKDEECRKTAVVLLGVICWGWEGGGRGVGKLELAYRRDGGGDEDSSHDSGGRNYKKDVEESMRVFIQGEVLRMVHRFRDDRDCMSSVLRIVLTLGESAVEDKGEWTDWLLSSGTEDGAFVVGLKMLWLVRHGEAEERVYKWCEDAVLKTDDLRVISVACSVVVKCLQVSESREGLRCGRAGEDALGLLF